MTSCKSIGYEVYRINFRCKCVCHKLKTTTDLPFYIWRTNSTTRKVPKTFSPHLYHVVGTLSPASSPVTETTLQESTLDPCGHYNNSGKPTGNDSNVETTTTGGDESETTADGESTGDSDRTGAGSDGSNGTDSSRGGDEATTAE